MGRFEGLTDVQSQVIESQLPKEPEKERKRLPACTLETDM